jgi:DNA-binding XRE family transcriptional regulator
MTKNTMSFAEQLKVVRRRERFSQAVAARLIPGLSTRTLQAWERNQQSPPLWAQSLVLDALGGAPYDPAKKRSVSSPRRIPQGT